MQRPLSRSQANLMLIIVACVWGFGFVPQKFAAAYLGPLSFNALKFLFGALVISPLVWREWRGLVQRQATPSRKDWLQIALMGALLAIGSVCQQQGIAATTVTNAGFLTCLYVPLVPLIAWLLYRKRAHWVVWPAGLACIVGTWMLTGAGKPSLNLGDAWVLASVIPFALHVLWIGALADKLGAPLMAAWGQFVVCGLITGLLAVPLESFDWANAAHVVAPLAYMSIVSVGIGFTGQVIAQRFSRPAEAAIILSSESVFSAIAGAALLHDRLDAIGYLGCVLIFAGIVLVQILPANQTPLIELH